MCERSLNHFQHPGLAEKPEESRPATRERGFASSVGIAPAEPGSVGASSAVGAGFGLSGTRACGLALHGDSAVPKSGAGNEVEETPLLGKTRKRRSVLVTEQARSPLRFSQ